LDVPVVSELKALVRLTTVPESCRTFNLSHSFRTRATTRGSTRVMPALEKNAVSADRARRCESWAVDMSVMSAMNSQLESEFRLT